MRIHNPDTTARMLSRRALCSLPLSLTGLVLTGRQAQAQISGMGDAINKAGRQRMFSQRMAQVYLAVQWNIDNAASQRELAKAREEFVPALEVLRNAPEATEQIKQELVLVDNQWLFFDNALKARATGQKAAADVFVTSENMLQVMDRVTSMYSRILG